METEEPDSKGQIQFIPKHKFTLRVEGVNGEFPVGSGIMASCILDNTLPTERILSQQSDLVDFIGRCATHLNTLGQLEAQQLTYMKLKNYTAQLSLIKEINSNMVFKHLVC